jgi:predicted chitinase
MAETQSTTTTTTEATAPTGDIKVFIDAFNKDFDIELKSLSESRSNYKNVYADAINISTPKQGKWPNNSTVITIGDLFKYTFPDIESDNVVMPPQPTVSDYEDYKGWSNDLKNNKDDKIKQMYKTISDGIRINSKILRYESLKKPGITNPSLWSPGQYYFDVFMSVMLSTDGPLKKPSDGNGGLNAFGGNIIEGGDWLNGWLETNGGSASVSNFNADGVGATGSFGYFTFYEIIDGGYSGVGVKYQVRNLTGIGINLDDASVQPPISFPNLLTQYKTGLLSEFISVENGKIILKDPTFQIYEGVILDPLDKEVEIKDIKLLTDITGYKFVGYYEHMPLYKAFIQAGDNYKSVVLPLRNSEQPTTTPDANPPLVKVTEPESQFKFNVEKTDTFIIVGGTASSAREFTIVPNNGSEFILENEIVDVFNDEELGEEYSEGEYQGTEEDLFKIEAGEPYPVVDTESLNSLKGFDPENPNESLSTDTSSKYPVSKDKDANIKAIIKSAKNLGVTNKFVVAAILAIVSKESGFVPRSESSYAGTSGARIAKIFGRRGYTDAEWDVIKKDPVKFFNIVYGPATDKKLKYGNGPTDGYKYRGRGFNQITFKGNYEQYAKEIGVDIVGDPDLLNTVDVAAKCVVAYFKRNIKKAPDSIKSRYHFTDINSFANLNDATGAIYHANAGWGKSYSEIVADSTGGRKKAFDKSGPLYNTYQSQIA